MNDPEKMLALNDVTGIVHDYKGTSPGGLGSEDNDMPVGIIPCGCDEFEEAVENNTLTMIRRRHLERGIWEPAECLTDGGSDD